MLPGINMSEKLDLKNDLCKHDVFTYVSHVQIGCVLTFAIEYIGLFTQGASAALLCLAYFPPTTTHITPTSTHATDMDFI